jgi:hypothetical protein
MNADGRDIHQILEYRMATAIVRLLPTGLLLIFLGLFIFALVDPDRESTWTFVGIGLCFVFGLAVIGFALWRRSNHGKPLFTLSPAGIRYRIAGVKEFLIPWREIKDVDTVDITGTQWSLYHGALPILFRNVTVVLVSKQFYDSRIFVNSFLLRGPYWDNGFIPQGSQVQVALHHDAVSVEPQALREAVEVRWLAFRDQPGPVRTSVPRITAAGKTADAEAHAAPKSKVVAMGDSPRAMPRWEAVKVIVLLIGIAAVATNIAELWEFPWQDRAAQAKVREERKQWAESTKRILEDSKRLEAEREKQRQELDQFWRRFDAQRPIR